MVKLVIRVDGDSGNEAGMGHVFRGLAYARKLAELIPNLDIHFMMREFPEGIQKVAGDGYSISTLPPRPEFKDYRKPFQNIKPDVLVIDTLGSNDELIGAARECSTRIITLDDLSSSAAKTDIIINGIIWATEWLPEKIGSARVYQGVEYMQLRDQFRSANQSDRDILPIVHNIMISTGGADGREFTPQLMEAVSGLHLEWQIEVFIIVGPAFKNRSLSGLAKQLTTSGIRFHIIENTQDMSSFLLQADLALITGGTVMFESAACGTPAIITCSYAHQVPQAEWFSSRSIVNNLGYFPEAVDKARVSKEITRLANDLDVRKQMSAIGKLTVDGQGLLRVAGIISREIKERVN